MIPRGYLLYKCREHPKTNERNEHLFPQKYDIELEGDRLKDLPIKIYRFLLKRIGYLKKMTRDVNLFLLLLFLHILEPHIILINNSYKIMQKVQECLVNKQSVFSKKIFLQHAILKAASSLQGKVILLLIKKSSAAKKG